MTQPDARPATPALPVRVAAYSRTSTEEQADRGTVEAQRTHLRDFARLYDLSIVDEYIDDGVSGSLPLGQRPEGKRLLDDAARGRFSTVIVFRLDRLGRSLASLLDAHAKLEGIGVTIRSTTEPFDTSTSIGRFLFQLLGGLAELERSTIAERMGMGRDRVARTGKWTGGPVPFGYDLDGEGCLTPSERVITGVGMTEADVARSVLERIADGSSTVVEARRLNALGVPTARRYSGGKQVTVGQDWLPSRINQMVRNSVYAGVHVLNSRRGPIQREVPALVARTTWERANDQLQRNRSLAKRNAKRVYALRGLLTCGECGIKYVGTTSRKASGWSGNYYRCGSQLGVVQPEVGRRCRSKHLRATLVEDLVWEDCRAFIDNPGESLEEARRRLEEQTHLFDELREERSRLERTLGAKDAARERIMTLYRREVVSLDEAEAQLGAVAAEAEGVRSLLEALKAQEDLAQATEMQLAQAGALLQQLRGRADEIERTGDIEMKRQIIDLLVRGIRVDTTGAGRNKEAALTIEYAFADPHAVNTTTNRHERSRGRD